MSDRTVINAAAFVRALATGMIAVLLGVALGKQGLTPAAIGWVVGAGLAGCAAAAAAATAAADAIGRKWFLVATALVGAAGALAFAAASSVPALAAAAFAGMLNGMGRDRGAAMIVEQAIIPGTAAPSGRTRAFAWYNVLQDAGHALGGLLAGLPAWLQAGAGVGDRTALGLSMGFYALLLLGTGVAYLGLSRAAEIPKVAAGAARLTPASRKVLARISALFALDSLGGGLLTTALLSFFFYKRFGIGEAGIGLLFFFARLLNALSHLAAAWLAARIGLLNTMVFTHIPSSLLLVTVPFAPTFTIAAILFLLREGLVEMDVPTRQSYVMAVVGAEERTIASGITHLVRLAAWALAPLALYPALERFSLGAPLAVGAGMKIAYDLLLYAAFRKVRPPEEAGG